MKNAHGFTVVELLVVTVVIAILAGIGIVSYTGIQKRAIITVAKTDVNNVAKKLEIYRLRHGTYPITGSGAGPMTAMEQILRETNLYIATRTVGTSRAKSFIYCTTPDLQHYIFASNSPPTIQFGDEIVYASSDFSGSKIFINDTTTTMTGVKICRSIAGSTAYDTGRWTHDIPTPGADAS